MQSFLANTRHHLGDQRVALLRADSGFSDNEFLDNLEAQQLHYTIALGQTLRYKLFARPTYITTQSTDAGAMGSSQNVRFIPPLSHHASRLEVLMENLGSVHVCGVGAGDAFLASNQTCLSTLPLRWRTWWRLWQASIHPDWCVPSHHTARLAK